MNATARWHGGTPPATDAVIPLRSVVRADEAIVGGRALRRALALQDGLPVPTGSVVVTTALGARMTGDFAPDGSTADHLDRLFHELGRSGRSPLNVSLSSVSPGGSAADRVPAETDITTSSELLHAVRRFSVTATILGDDVAAIIQCDVAPVLSGGFVVGRRLGARIGLDLPQGLRRRLSHLGEATARAFPGSRLLNWSLDATDHLWVVDIGPELDHHT